MAGTLYYNWGKGRPVFIEDKEINSIVKSLLRHGIEAAIKIESGSDWDHLMVVIDPATVQEETVFGKTVKYEEED